MPQPIWWCYVAILKHGAILIEYEGQIKPYYPNEHGLDCVPFYLTKTGIFLGPYKVP